MSEKQEQDKNLTISKKVKKMQLLMLFIDFVI